MTIRGNAGDSTRSAPLTAQRPLSIALVRSASALPPTATTPSYELPPIGLAYIAAALKQAGHRVQIIDAFGENPGRLVRHAAGFTTVGLTAEEIVERIPRDVDLIGVSCMFSNSWI